MPVMANEPADRSEAVASAVAFLKRELPAGWRGVGALDEHEREEFLVTWRKKLVDAHLLGLSWPTEYGGAGMSLADQSEVQRLFAQVGAPLLPAPSDPNGFALLGPTIMAIGTEEQKRYFLPRILTGEHRWAQGYSEPDAGSDLFALRTKAELDGNEWVIDGQKVWTSHGHHANWLFALVRTDPKAPKAKGLSFLLLPIEQSGVLVRTIRTMTGDNEFSEVFLDGARTDAANILGKPGDGAKVALSLLGFERSTAAAAKYVGYDIEFRRLCRLAAEHGLIDDPTIRRELARCYTKIEIMGELGRASIASAVRGEQPGAESSILKMYESHYHQMSTELAMRILGAEGILRQGPLGLGGMSAEPLGAPNSTYAWQDQFMMARAKTIYGGSAQIQRSTIGERILGLPREPRAMGGGE
jgi:alkylation response protein AidB-like acyl-CoA dehydrogenase